MDKRLVKISLFNALGTVAYITLVVLALTGLEKYAGDKPDGFFAPVLALTLFVVSAAVTGSLVLGKPVLMYLAGEKTGAVKLFVYTLSWLGAALVVLLVLNFT